MLRYSFVQLQQNEESRKLKLIKAHNSRSNKLKNISEYILTYRIISTASGSNLFYPELALEYRRIAPAPVVSFWNFFCPLPTLIPASNYYIREFHTWYWGSSEVCSVKIETVINHHFRLLSVQKQVLCLIPWNKVLFYNCFPQKRLHGGLFRGEAY